MRFFSRFRVRLLAGVISLYALSCSTPQRGLFGGKKSAHAFYSEGITKAGLDQTELGNKWFAAATKSLDHPLTISLPYKETGYFSADQPGAAGYRFSARRGDLLHFSVITVPAKDLIFFAELWQPADAGDPPKLLTYTDTSSRGFQYELEKDGYYVVRVQPELLKGVEYTLTINTSASLAFPVQSTGNPRITSLWGAARDGGARKHEGIDIVAKFRTPALAAANGYVTRVNEGGLGGKVVFMRPDGKSFNLYYAHLDSQSVKQGQQVKVGDIIGLIGNTGNAEYTSPHLHFGIYSPGGAVDPLPFIDRDRSPPKNISVRTANLNAWARTQSETSLFSSPSTMSTPLGKVEQSQVVKVIAATESFYKVQFPDGTQGYLPGNKLVVSPLRKQILSVATRLLDQPRISAASITGIAAGSEVQVLGISNKFMLVNFRNLIGWIYLP